ncbi:M3 family metallopeptidase [soil metagenome]
MPSANPLLEVSVPVPFDEVRVEHIQPAVAILLERAQAALDAIVAAPSPRTYASTLEALDLATTNLDYANGLVTHLESVTATPELREAFAAITTPLTAFYSRMVLSARPFEALRDFDATSEAKALDPVRRRFLTKTLADFRRNGAALDATGKKRLGEIDVALSELTLKFAQNVVDSTAAYELLIDEADSARLAGLPEGVVGAARKSAEEKGRKGYRLTLQAPSYGPVLSFAHDRALRETLYRAFSTRASSHGPGGAAFDKRALVEEVIALRHEKARLLGFAHFADLLTDDRMVKNGASALAFVGMLRDRLQPGFEEENAALMAFAAARGHQGPLELWDLSYFAEGQRRALFDFDDETLRPYFPLDRVTRGLFEVATSLFGITIERDPVARTWHEDVTAWAVLDADGKRLGGFYLDLFPRETKRDGAWMAPLVERMPGTAREKENVAIVVANLTPPQRAGEPALLTHREVQTIFHEFGHMMHHVLSEVAIRTLAGTRVASDFVELPSMIMENWCWEKEALDRFARHYETGAPIPDAIKQRMLAARTYRAANAEIRQLGFSNVDLLLHTEYDPGANGGVMEYARDKLGGYLAAPLPADYAMLASFIHVFGSAYGYAAGYYSYQWAEVLEADAFGSFRDGGILSRDIGERFRRVILARGDSEDPAVLYRTFLGRDPDVAALLTRLGIAA